MSSNDWFDTQFMVAAENLVDKETIIFCADFITLRGGLIMEAALIGYCIHVVRGQKTCTTKMNWLQGAVIAVLRAYGGGILVPVLIGHESYTPFPLGNDAAVACVLLAFSLARYSPWQSLMNSFVVRFPTAILFEIARCFMMLNWLKAGASVLPASYFKLPMVGPIICGTLGGCGGAFLPFEKDLPALKSGAPYALSTALGATVFFYATVYVAPAYDSLTAYQLAPFHAHACCAVALCTCQLLRQIVPEVERCLKKGKKKSHKKKKKE